jgi:Putative transposase of IS4/5 family (DUF4096)
LVLAMSEPEDKRAFRLGWSIYRRAHQAVAARCKKASRAAKRAFHQQGWPEGPSAPEVATLPPEGAPLTDTEWEMVKRILPPRRFTGGRPYHDHRIVLGGILWVARTGSSWREMPQEFGKWETAYRRYELWVNQGLWPRILEALGEEMLPGPATEEPN